MAASSLPNRATIPVVTHASQSPTETWDDPTRGNVQWWTLLSGDRTPTDTLTCGVAEIPPGEADVLRTHSHLQAEVYHFLSGSGVVFIDGVEDAVYTGSTVFIPGNAIHGVRNTGAAPLRLFYVFAVDSFADVAYVFPGAAIPELQG